MSNAKLSSSDHEEHPSSGQRPAANYRPVSSAERETTDGGFSGTCDNMSLADWIQLVQMGRRDAIVGIRRHDGKKALLWCREGDIIDAWCDGTLGEDAVYRALTWSGGRVSVTFASFEHPRRIEMATSALLLNAAYHKDSVVRHRDSLVRDLKPVSQPSNPLPAPAIIPESSLFEGDPSLESSPSLEQLASPTSSLAPTTLFQSVRSPSGGRLWIASALLLLPLLVVLWSLSGTARTRNVSNVAPRPAQPAPLRRATAEQPVVTPVTHRASPPDVRSAGSAEAATPKAPKPEPREAAKVARAPAPRPSPSAVAAIPKSAPKPNASSAMNEQRAPRVQIIDEPSSKIEVIE